MKVHGAKALNELKLLSYSPFEEISFLALDKRFCDLPHSHSVMSSSSHAQQLRLPLHVLRQYGYKEPHTHTDIRASKTIENRSHEIDHVFKVPKNFQRYNCWSLIKHDEES